ncbi:MAG: L-serine ammonia-lyase, iron-sulfur-dependent subunit beta, partial [bacterium]
MKTYRVFDIIGPRMIGPSSSHTAGAARLGLVAARMLHGDVRRAEVTLYESFATTGLGHGTGKAIVGGLLGMEPEDERLRVSFALAQERGLSFHFTFSEEPAPHPNTARIEAEDSGGGRVALVGASVGGGNIEILEVNGMEVSFTCQYPTLLGFYTDRPGVIQRVTSVLAEQNINIAFMRVFRTSRRQKACM